MNACVANRVLLCRLGMRSRSGFKSQVCPMKSSLDVQRDGRKEMWHCSDSLEQDWDKTTGKLRFQPRDRDGSTLTAAVCSGMKTMKTNRSRQAKPGFTFPCSFNTHKDKAVKNHFSIGNTSTSFCLGGGDQTPTSSLGL